MLRLRICASIVSMLSAATVILALVLGTGPVVPIVLLTAAACLAIVSPFDAPNPRERTRVSIACLAYFTALAAAFALVLIAAISSTLTIAILTLLQFGVVLTCWAFATRNRRRIPRSRRYFDN